MDSRSSRMAILLALAAAACARSAPAPQAAPAPMQVVDQSQQNPAAVARADKGIPPFVQADVKFMQGMIGHHAQAVEMVALINDRTANPSMKLLGMRIQISQEDEMNMMRAYLKDRGAAIRDMRGALKRATMAA